MNLGLFFSLNVSLDIWVSSGFFDREKQIYEQYLNQGIIKKAYWFTYGKGDHKIAEGLKREGKLHKDIIVLPALVSGNKLVALLNAFLIPFVYRRQIRDIDLIKTNQTSASFSAFMASFLYRKPIIVRSGYLVSNSKAFGQKSNFKQKAYGIIEKLAYTNCDKGVITSLHNKEYLCGKYKIDSEKIEVIGNYIDVNLFKPIEASHKDKHLVFVGRLSQEKNLFNLIEAVHLSGFNLDIYGKGPLLSELKGFARKLSASVNFLGVVDNSTLPQILSNYKYFILPSIFEGMPKAILEAMSCGLVVLGTNIGAFSGIIRDGETGFLIEGTDTSAIAKALGCLGKNAVLEDKVAKQAREYIVDNFSLESIVAKEGELIRAYG